MSYRIEFKPSAARQFEKLPVHMKKKLAPVIDRLMSNPRPRGCKKLTAAKDIYRVRSGDYRIIYQIKDDILLILVLKIGHRREIYR